MSGINLDTKRFEREPEEISAQKVEILSLIATEQPPLSEISAQIGQMLRSAYVRGYLAGEKDERKRGEAKERRENVWPI